MSGINYQAVGKDLVESLKGKPYGSIPKKELDLLLFSILYNNGYYNGKSNYEISLELMISEVRLDNLLYDMKLRQPKENSEESVINQIRVVLQNVSYNVKTDKIILIVNNLFIKNHISSKLKSLGVIHDYSFNKNLIILDKNAFIVLLTIYTDEEKQQKILEEFGKEEENMNKDFAKLLSEELNKTIEAAKENNNNTNYDKVNTITNLLNFAVTTANIFGTLLFK